jgi:7,8-dihydropterin-6-yl-methyl-4-(beta-D-ribofuranosyl)aminobenzene 5'-phosphate synthase
VGLVGLSVALIACRTESGGCVDLSRWVRQDPAACEEQVGVTVVYDNNEYDARLETDWGFACWVQYGDAVVLFDTGADGEILQRNLANLGLDPGDIDWVVLSHIHQDHTGGLQGLLDAGHRPEVVVPVTFPTSYKDQLRQQVTVHEVDEAQELLPGLYTTGKMGLNIPEQGLVLKSNQGLVVITGCAHPGIVDMVRQAKAVGGDDLCLVMGGFHLGQASEAQLKEICGAFRDLGVINVAPGHCTGEAAVAALAEAYGDQCLPLGVGWGMGICP